MIAAQFSPSSTKPVTAKVQIVLNGNNDDSPWLTLAGCARNVSVHLDASTMLSKPTCIGSSSTRTFQLTNSLTLPAAFAWDIPPHIADVFSIQPASGVVAGNSHATMQCSFQPVTDGKVSGDVICYVRGGMTAEIEAAFPGGCPLDLKSGGQRDSCLSLELVGVAAEALVSISPLHKDIGEITVGQSVRIPVTLCNGSVGAVQYSISAVDANGLPLELIESGDETEDARKANGEDSQDLEVSVEKMHGILSGRASLDVDVVFKTRGQMQVHFDLVCAYGQVSENAAPSSSSPQVSTLCLFPLFPAFQFELGKQTLSM